MGVIIPQVVTEDRASGGQVVDGSLRFDSNGDTTPATSQRLARTFGSAGDTQKMTMSVWVKRTVFTSSNTDSGTKTLFGAASGGSRDQIRFEHNASSRGDQLSISLLNDAASANECFLSTGPLFRDPSAWYHIVWAIDTTQGTAANRVKLYVNGTQITDFSGNNTQPGQNFTINYFNNNVAHEIGRDPSGSNQAFDGYMSNFYWIDGQQLDSSYFGFTDPLTNTWKPKKYTGTFGTNGFWLPLDGDALIGKDKSGNGNDFTPSGFGGTNSIEKATGAFPILNTSNGGRVATIGQRSDSNSSSLVLALPLVGNANDIHHLIKGSGSAKTVTSGGNAAATSVESNFYGASYVFDGTGDYLSLSSTSDFGFGTGDFTIECFVYYKGSFPTYEYIFDMRVDSSTGSELRPALYPSSNGGALEYYLNGSTVISGGSFRKDRWYHVAVVRNSGTTTLYLDGTDVGSFSDSNNYADAPLVIGQRQGFSAQSWDGYIQDFRIYKGVAKYTSEFIPASTDPNILPDTPSGVAGGSALTKITDGAVSLGSGGTGANTTEYLNFANINFSTNDLTIEGWFYNRTISNDMNLWATNNGSGSSNPKMVFYINAGNLTLHFQTGTVYLFDVDAATYIPPFKWHHIAVTREGGSNWALWIDGNRVATDTDTRDLSSITAVFNIGHFGESFGSKFNGFVSNFRIVNGTALYDYTNTTYTLPTAPLTNVTNTAFLGCQSNTSATAAVVTPGSITANGNAAATNFNPFTTDIHAVRGQESGWATLNPIDKGSNLTLSDGNLSVTNSSTWGTVRGTVGVSTGKWYYEFTMGGPGYTMVGVASLDENIPSTYLGAPSAGSYGYFSSNGTLYLNGSTSTTWSTFTTGDVIGVALDATNGSIWFSKNGVWQGGGNPASGTSALITSIPSDVYTGAISAQSTDGTPGGDINFGQKPFKYAPPEGFKTLCLANLPRPTKASVRPDKYCKTILYTGNGATQSITGLGFQPDFVWCKSRDEGTTSYTGHHVVQDTVRGTGNTAMVPNEDYSEANTGYSDAITSFDRDGFTLGARNQVNYSGDTFVAWCWKAGDAAVTNNDGSAASQVSANRDSGFSIVTYTGQSANFTWGHGLGVAPSMVWIKRRNTNAGWSVYHKSLGATKRLQLNQEVEAETMSYFQNTAPTDTVFSVTTNGGTGADGDTYLAYCWSEVPGFSKFGSYTGNGNADGPFIHLGFRPAWVMWKQTTTNNDRHWVVRDSVRDVDNPTGQTLYPSTSGAEQTLTSQDVDFLSNGFKIRSTWDYQNASSQTYIFAAFAEAPTNNLFGGQANAR